MATASTLRWLILVCAGLSIVTRVSCQSSVAGNSTDDMESSGNSTVAGNMDTSTVAGNMNGTGATVSSTVAGDVSTSSPLNMRSAVAQSTSTTLSLMMPFMTTTASSAAAAENTSTPPLVMTVGSGDDSDSSILPFTTTAPPLVTSSSTAISVTGLLQTTTQPPLTDTQLPSTATISTISSPPGQTSSVVPPPFSTTPVLSTASPFSTVTPSLPPVMPTTSPVAGIVAAVVVIMILLAVVVVVLIFVLIFITRRQKRKHTWELDQLLNGTDSAGQIALKEFKPSSRVNLDALFAHIPEREVVMLTDLEQHLCSLEDEESNSDREFVTVQENDQEFPNIASKSPANYDKNRYINILPYDQTRVLLVDLPKMPGSNYINANYIAGYNSNTEFIATQGPIASTIPDFWRMVWEQQTRNIVMVTNPVEGGITKCEVYWPREGTAQKYGVVSVTSTREEVIPTCTIRKFMLSVAQTTKNKERQVLTREVTQFCFTAWPDMGVPEDASAMLKFVTRVRAAAQSDDGPIVVHCSAGVGRTGTYIAIDVQLQRMKHEENLNVPEFVMQMRAQRAFMVQTEAQYIFIYKTILYAYLYGITELHGEQLQNHIEKLQLAFPNSEDSHLDKEYCGAVDVLDPEEDDMNVALSYQNADKNRNTKFLPFDDNRLVLSDPDATGSDYINASFVGVLGRTKEYVIAEHPLPSTVPDFWKMMLDRGISTIVIMGPTSDDDEIYWPRDEDPEEFESVGVTVQLLEHEDEKGLSATMVEVECEETEQRQTVSFLQLTDWPTEAGEVPTSTDSMIQLVSLVRQHTNGRVLVHTSCSLEAEASGVFCIINSLARRLNEGGAVDVMKSTTHLLNQRSHVIVSKEQYMFIYETLEALNKK